MQAIKLIRYEVGASRTSNDRLVAEHPNHMWALDFAYDHTAACPTLEYSNVTDEFTTHALTFDVERSLTGDDISTVLERLVINHEVPNYFRMDNGTEMTSNPVENWCQYSLTRIAIIDLSSPWQITYVESFIRRLRDEVLAVGVLHTLLEAQVKAKDYRQHLRSDRQNGC